MSKEWTIDVFAEQKMREMGIEWKIEEIPISEIDWEESVKNHARIGPPINEEFVEDLVAGFKSGSKFPMLVVRRSGKKNIIQGGNHRGEGAKRAGLATVMAYVFTSTDDKIINNLQKMLNPPTLGSPKCNRLVFAKDAVIRDGYEVRDAAKMFNIGVACLRNFLRAIKVQERLCGMGVDGAIKLTTHHLNILARITNPNVLLPAGRLVCRGRFNGDETIRLVNEIMEEETEGDQIAVVVSKEKVFGLDKGDPAPGTTSPKGKRDRASIEVKECLSKLEKRANVRTINQWGISDKIEKARIIDRIEKLVRKLQAICKRSV